MRLLGQSRVFLCRKNEKRVYVCICSECFSNTNKERGTEQPNHHLWWSTCTVMQVVLGRGGFQCHSINLLFHIWPLPPQRTHGNLLLTNKTPQGYYTVSSTMFFPVFQHNYFSSVFPSFPKAWCPLTQKQDTKPLPNFTFQRGMKTTKMQVKSNPKNEPMSFAVSRVHLCQKSSEWPER